MLFPQAIILALLVQTSIGFHNAHSLRGTHVKESHTGYVSTENNAMIDNAMFEPVLFTRCKNLIAKFKILVDELTKKAHDVEESDLFKYPLVSLEKKAQKYARTLHVIYLRCNRHIQHLTKVGSRSRIKSEPKDEAKDYIRQPVSSTPLQSSGSAPNEQRDTGFAENERPRASSFVQKLRDRMIRSMAADEVDFSIVKATALKRVLHLLWKNMLVMTIIMFILYCFFGDLCFNPHWYKKIAGFTRNDSTTASLNGGQAAELPLLAMERAGEGFKMPNMNISLPTKNKLALACKGPENIQNTNEDQVEISIPESPQPVASTPKPRPVGETSEGKGLMNKVPLPTDWSVSPIVSTSSSCNWYNEVSSTSVDLDRVRTGEKNSLQSPSSGQSPIDIEL